MISVHACPLARLGSKETGGMNVYVRELATALAAQGHGVDVYTRRTDPDEPMIVEMARGTRVIRLPAGEPGPMDKNAVYHHLPQFIAGLEQYRRERGIAYDLVHSHYWLSSWTGARLAQMWGVPHVTMFHTLGEVKNRCGAPGQESALRIAVEREAVAAATRIVAASEDERRHLVDIYDADPQRVEIIPCGVNTRLFRPFDKRWARATLGLEGGWLALFVGRMDPLKGLAILLEATSLLADEAPDLRTVVVGGDASPESEEARLYQLTKQLGLDGRVQFQGAVPQTELPLYYSAADVCVVPSFYESFGLVAVEALACGTPVIASRVGGLPVVVKHGENGLLVERRSPETFAASIRCLYRDEARRAALVASARPSIEYLNWRAIAGQVNALYGSLAAGRGDGTRGRRACLPCSDPILCPSSTRLCAGWG